MIKNQPERGDIMMPNDTQAARDYRRIEAAIRYINAHYQEAPSLAAIADAVHVSPFHFQRLFSRWAGVSPNQFMRCLSLGHAKALLADGSAPLLDVAYETGLSGDGRLHDLFVTIEGMTPGQYKNGGRDLVIRHALYDSPFGPVIIASTAIGTCHIGFVDEDEGDPMTELRAQFPEATFIEATFLEAGSIEATSYETKSYETKSHEATGYERGNDFHRQAVALLNQKAGMVPKAPLKLHVKGTGFQIKILDALLRIPGGGVASYQDVATYVCSPAATRAAASAIAANPVAVLIPCHRVIQKTGQLGGYRWGPLRKQAMIGWEGSQG